MVATGQCGCGGVRYQTEVELRQVWNCHCERCRRFTGHFMAGSGCARSALDVEPSESLRWYEPSRGVRYGFCSTCGSSLFWEADEVGDWVSICAGTLDQPTGLSTVVAWWVAEAADYHQLDPDPTNYDYEP